ncbi:MAG: hypothetical protein A3E78_15280 [Alphaproteobacteria bacterium RIFCSPHIGHO2_12_FULL_63_12]|nr:MAG: hypothetical protein A3E78_15280 [Alphaproteobacteria bacterium RIFCSPHIGHO2_12_FULL_63_12]
MRKSGALSDESRINIDVAGVFRGRRRVVGGFPGEAFANRWIDLQIVIKGGYIEIAVQAAS